MMNMRKAVSVAAMVAGLVLAGAGTASADANAIGEASNSPGVLSGNLIQIPVDVPINVCGNSVNVIGLANPAFGNTCVNDSGPSAEQPTWHHTGWNHDGWHEGWHHAWHHHHFWHEVTPTDDNCC